MHVFECMALNMLKNIRKMYAFEPLALEMLKKHKEYMCVRILEELY